MNILELDSYRLADAVKFNNRLNPKIWGSDEKMLPEVREQLLKISDDFREFLGVNDFQLKDITVSGSNAAYTYTPHSDIDLHLVVDLPEADKSEVYRELFDAKKYQYNNMHNFKIGGYDVELYVQNANQTHHSQGIYSVLNNNWVDVPKRRKPTVDDISTRSKYEDLQQRIDSAIESGNFDTMNYVAMKIKEMRQAGLDAHGEFGPENLAFKMLRSQGKIKELYDARNAARDQELSLKERNPVRSVFTYGFKHESELNEVGMTPDGVSPETKMFLSEQDPEPTDEEILKDFIDFCTKELKIDHLPTIKLRRDPQWAVVHKTFGRYINDKHLLEVAWGQRHIMDVLRTVAHELTHTHQHERDGSRMGATAGETGSPWENEANARAGVLMRDYARLHPEYFAAGQAEELHIDEVAMAPHTNKKTAGSTRIPEKLVLSGYTFIFDRASRKVTVTYGGKPVTTYKYNGADNYNNFIDTADRVVPAMTPSDLSSRHGEKRAVTVGQSSFEYPTNDLYGVDLPHGQLEKIYRQHDKDTEQHGVVGGITDFGKYSAIARRRRQAAQDGNDVETLKEFDPGGYQERYKIYMGDYDLEETFADIEDAVQAIYEYMRDDPKSRFEDYNVRDLNGEVVWRAPEQEWEKPGRIQFLPPNHGDNVAESASGYIPTRKQSRDPRYSMALTVDIKPGAVGKNANKLKLNTDSQGQPQIARPNGLVQRMKEQLEQFKKKGVTEVLDTTPGKANRAKWNNQADMVELDFVASNGIKYTLSFIPPYMGPDEFNQYTQLPDATDEVLDAGAFVDFEQTSKNPYGPGKQGIEGTGSAAEVFGIVYNAVLQYVKKHQPTYLFFQAAELNRRSLYTVLIRKMLPALPGWKFKQAGGEFVVYNTKYFKKNKLAEAEELDEVKMSPTALKKFAASPAAEGIMVGFEAELIVPDVAADDADRDMEPDYEADERCRSVQQVIEFFEYDEYGYGISGRDAENLQEKLDEAYFEWQDEQMMRDFREEAEDLIKKVMIDEKDWVQEDEVRKQLDMMEITGEDQEAVLAAGSRAPTFKTSTEQQAYMEEHPEYEKYFEALEQAEDLLDELVLDSVRAQDKYWDAAIDDFRDSYYVSDDSGFFDDVGLRYMSDVANRFDIYWPYMTFEEGEGSQDIDSVADSLSEALGMPVVASYNYHGATRKPGQFIVEPDGSLSPDSSADGGLEIISPPMPIAQAMEKLNQVIKWAQDRGCYTNSSTGLHMGVSLPGQKSFAEDEGDAEPAPAAEKPIDFMKLALFLGDQHVLKQFERQANSYCRSSLEKLKEKRWSPQQIATAMEKMRGNLINLAYKDLADRSPGRDSINMKDNYVEFRGAGGDYLSKESDQGMDFLENTLLRYVQALAIAGDPSAHRNEYAKKLYKLISPEGDTTLDLFSKFATGEISSEQLKKDWAKRTLEKDSPESVVKGEWIVINTVTGKPVEGQSYNGYTKQEVYDKAKQKLSPASSDTDFKQSYEIMPQNTGKWEIYTKDSDTGKEEALEIVDAERRGQAIDKVSNKYLPHIQIFARPYYGDAKAGLEKEPTRRAKLAQQIVKQGPGPKVYYKWDITNPKNGETGIDYMTRDRVFQTTRQVEKENPKGGKYTNTIIGQGSAQLTSNQHPREIDKMTFDFRVKGSDEVIEQKTFDRETDSVEGGYTSPVVVAIERANELSKELGKPVTAYEVADTTAKPAQAKDYNYEIVNLGDVNLGVVDKFYATDKQDADATFDKWLEMKGLPNDTSNYGYRPRKQEPTASTNPNPTASIANQARAPNGVPMWELFDLDTGSVVHTIADHTGREAYSQGMAWLRSIGAEEPETYGERFAIKPKMAAPANWRGDLERHVQDATNQEQNPFERNSDRIDAIRGRTPDATEQTGTWQLVDVTLNQPVETYQGTWAEADRIATQYETGPGEHNGHEISVRGA